MNTLYRFLCEEPLKEQVNNSTSPTNEEQIPVKYKRVLNCQVEDETVVHVQGGKGFAVVDKNISEQNDNSEFYEWKVLCFSFHTFQWAQDHRMHVRRPIMDIHQMSNIRTTIEPLPKRRPCVHWVVLGGIRVLIID